MRCRTFPATSRTPRPPATRASTPPSRISFRTHDARQAGRRRRHRFRTGDHHHPGHRLGHDRRDQHGDQRRRLLLGAEAVLGGRQRAGVQRRHRLYAPRRLSGQRQRQSGQRRRLLFDGRRRRSQDRQPDRQRSAGAAVPEQFHPGPGHHRHSIRREPSDPAENAGKFHRGRRHHHRGRRHQPLRLRSQSLAGRHAGAARRRHHHRRCRQKPVDDAGRDHRRHALSGAANTNSLAAGFANGDTITVDGTTISFVTTGATGNQLNITDNVGSAARQDRSASPASTASISGTGADHAAYRHRAESEYHRQCGQCHAALGALGFGAPPIIPARAAGTRGTGVVTGNDLHDLHQRIHQRRRGDGLQLRPARR